MISRICCATLLAAGLVLSAGCSNLDFSRSLSERISGIGTSGKPFIEGEQELERAAAMERLTRLEAALKLWEPVRAASGEYRIGAGDLLELGIMSLDTPGQATVLRRDVGEDGYISLPLVDRVKAIDLTTKELENQVRVAYRETFLKRPQIVVTVAEYRSAAVVITGAVMKPGVCYLNRGSSTVLELLLQAGGLAASAGDELYVLRAKDRLPVPAVASNKVAGITGSAPFPTAATHALTPEPEPAALTAREARADVADRMARGERVASAATGGGLLTLAAVETMKPLSALSADVPPAPASSPAVAMAPSNTAATLAPSGTLSVATAEAGLIPTSIAIDLRRLIDAKDVRLNVTVQAGDIISVPSRDKQYIYVLGYVGRPGPIEMGDRLRIDVLNALAMAGGPSVRARVQKSYIIRETPEGKRVIPLDLIKIAHGVRPTVHMEAGDTLVVGSGMLMKALEIFSVGGALNYSPAIP